MRNLIPLLIGAALAAGAQTGASNSAISGPIVGWIEDAQSQVRPVVGVPGASWQGAPVPMDAGIRALAIAPLGSFLLGVIQDAGALVIVRPLASSPQASGIDGVTGVARAVLSPGGTAALAWDGARSASILTGLAGSPSVAWTADLSSLPSMPAAFALTDDGAAILAAAPNGDHVSIFLITAAAGARSIATAGALGGLAFAPRSHDAVYADAQSNQVQLISDVTGSPASRMLAEASAGVGSPIDVAISEDGQRLFIANANPAGVLSLDISTSAGRFLPCECSPTALGRMNRTSVFSITDPAAGLFWIFDGGATIPRILAVPPPEAAQ